MSDVASADPAAVELEEENRIDDNAIEAFRGMGYEGRLSDNLVTIYKRVKSKKDDLQPGRLSPEGFAFVIVLSEMADGKLQLKHG